MENIAKNSLRTSLAIFALAGLTKFGVWYSDRQEQQRALNEQRAQTQEHYVPSLEEIEEASIEYEQRPEKRFRVKIQEQIFRLANPDLIETNSPLVPKTLKQKVPTSSTQKYDAPKANESYKTITPITKDFIERLTKQESQYNPNAVSPKGARGLMQIMPETWSEVTQKLYGKELSYHLAFHPDFNKEVGIRYLQEIDRMLTNSLPRYDKMSIIDQQKHILAAYNGGIGKLKNKRFNITRMPKETRNYVKKICEKS